MQPGPLSGVHLGHLTDPVPNDAAGIYTSTDEEVPLDREIKQTKA